MENSPFSTIADHEPKNPYKINIGDRFKSVEDPRRVIEIRTTQGVESRLPVHVYYEFGSKLQFIGPFWLPRFIINERYQPLKISN